MSEQERKFSIRARRRARVLATQALYQWQFNPSDIEDINAEFCEYNQHLKVDWDFFKELTVGVTQNIKHLDDLITPCLQKSILIINNVEHAILRLACYEIKYLEDIHYKVSIKEYIKVVEEFGNEHGDKFIHGALGSIIGNED
ncbi:MAG: transcription antitermination factor NusB [Alcanivoracaceae bacterium]|nr:transcription antitermination factor NusB [Alcanivoracaceae bacterium]